MNGCMTCRVESAIVEGDSYTGDVCRCDCGYCEIMSTAQECVATKSQKGSLK